LQTKKAAEDQTGPDGGPSGKAGAADQTTDQAASHQTKPRETGPSGAHSGRAGGEPLNLDDIDLGEIDLADLESEAANPLAGCVMCHTDVGDQFQGSVHQKEAVGCTDCHGESKGHVADENNEVKPDEVFARKDVDRRCSECHECSRPGADRPPAESPATRHVCTDCHGSHKLAKHASPPATSD